MYWPPEAVDCGLVDAVLDGVEAAVCGAAVVAAPATALVVASGEVTEALSTGAGLSVLSAVGAIGIGE